MPRIDRTLAIYGLALALGGALFVLLFWGVGAINLQRGAGLITQLDLDGMWRTAFYMYPFVTFAAIFGALVAFFANREDVALGIAGLPIAGLVLYYLALVTFH